MVLHLLYMVFSLFTHFFRRQTLRYLKEVRVVENVKRNSKRKERNQDVPVLALCHVLSIRKRIYL